MSGRVFCWAGIVLSPMAVRYFALHQPERVEEMSFASQWVRYLGTDGSIVVDRAAHSTAPFINWLWYRNIPAQGMVREENIATLHQNAAATFPPRLTELILNSKQPFINLHLPQRLEQLHRYCFMPSCRYAIMRERKECL